MINNCRLCQKKLPQNPQLIIKSGDIPAQGFLKKNNQKTLNNLSIYQCSFCGVTQHNSNPVSYYKDVIRATAFSKQMEIFRIKQIKSWINKYDLYQKNIIEVGSGRSEFMEIFNKLNHSSIYGIENSTQNFLYAKEKGYRVYKGYLGDSKFKKINKKFGAFTCFSFMEHWPNLNQCFINLHSILTSQAIGLIEVPNLDLIMEKQIYTEFTIDHIFYFSPKTLKLVFEMNGFDVISVNKIWHDYILSAVVQKREIKNLNYFKEKKQKINKSINELIKKFGIDKTTIWGAGHQSISIISQSGVYKKLSFIVDSAVFKQNLYIYGLNTIVLPPEVIKTKGIDTVIIIAAGFSDEIAKILKKKFKDVKNIFILRENFFEKIK